jgi:site-specific DNA-adenine methylase
MLRFGPNGMNQSYGNRAYQYYHTENQHLMIRERLNKTEILNLDFFKTKSLFEDLDALFFIDPPYIKRETSYSNIEMAEKNSLLNFMKNKDYIYTDIYEENIETFLNCNIKVLRDKMRNTSPLSDKEKIDNTEVIYTNLTAREVALF